MNDTVKKIKKDLEKAGDENRAMISRKFFKTGKGEYGEGDIFLGIRVPVLRSIAKKYDEIDIEEISALIKSEYHEERLLSVLMMVNAFKRSDGSMRRRIYESYLDNTEYINNWDIVDISASNIAGAYLEDKDKKPIYDLALSESLWERRISIISTHYFIKKKSFEDTLNISDILINDKHDLIHKAVGWMLREVGKMDIEVEENFLKNRYKSMPRTMLRYAVEKLEEKRRKKYLRGEI